MYDLGDLVPLTANVRDANGTLANAGAATLTISLPDGTTATPTPTNPTTGVYAYDYAAPQAGRYEVAWVFTGTNAGALRDSFDVSAAPPLVSVADAQAHLNWSTAATAADVEELRRVLQVASRVCEKFTGRRWRRATVVETRQVDGATLSTYQAPILSVTSVLAGATLVPAGDYTVRGDLGVIVHDSYWPAGDLVVTYVTGATSIPEDVSQGVLEMTRHLWQTQRGPSRLPLADPGSDYQPGSTYSIPRRVAELWEPYVRGGFA